MNEKEIAEIRKRLKHDKNNITKLYGCYVSANKEIKNEFVQTVGLIPLETNEMLFNMIKKTLSGRIGRNLHDISFRTEQVGASEEHQLLMTLRDSELQNEAAVHELYEKIVNSYPTDENYLILLGCDTYDLPNLSKNDETMEDDSTEVFRYIICCVCPIKLTKTMLGFSNADNTFGNIGADNSVSAPEIGFMFPAFDDRSTNIYNAVYYTKSADENYETVTDTLFNTEVLMPASEQKETFQSLIAETAGDDCNYELMQNVHEHITEMIAEHKNAKADEDLSVGKTEIRKILTDCGVSEDNISKFDENYDNSFGEKTSFNPQNIIDEKNFEIKTPDVTIKVKPDKSYLLETKVIDGVKYVMVRAEEGVEVNGVKINIAENR